MATTRPGGVFILALLLFPRLGNSPPASAGELEISSSAVAPIPGGVSRNASVVPALDLPGKYYKGDWAKSQVLEIVRPRMAAFSVKFVAVSCTCLGVELEKRDFAEGERALLEVRNLKKTPEQGAVYAIFLELETPEPLLVEYDIFVKSDPVPVR
ncbi:MAG: hypothetical protein LBU64_04635 [Planctomycetota bacterium]|jgi:hypothetical protein|nr:hypothetical protein [Planctomycetota bacterium]